MKPKRTNIKIKHHKYNLYNRRKSRGKQALAIILTVVIAAALAVIGYGAGRPLVEYLTGKNSETSESTPSWTPPVTSVEPESDAQADGENSSVSSETSGPEQTAAEIPLMYVLPQDVVYDAQSLKNAAAAAKNAGYSGIAVTAKDSVGNILYKSEIAGIRDGATVTGTLSAKEMCRIIEAEGLVPAARFSTLLDRSNPNYIAGGYMISDGSGSWLDAAPANGGKRWFSPFGSATAEFMKDIAEELATAGFKYIIAADTMYPDFHASDINTYLYDLPLTDAEKRTDALWSVLDAAKSGAEDNGAEFAVQLSADALFSDDRQATDAECADDRSKLHEASLLISYAPDGKTSAYTAAKSFIGRMGAQFSGQKYSVLIDGSAVSENDVSEARRAFAEEEIAVYVK